jgi:hypothetical protein
VALLEESGAHLIMSWNRACLAEALAMAGHDGKAEQMAELALERGSVHDWLGEPPAHRALARVAARRDPPDWKGFDKHIDAALERSAKKKSKREAAITRLAAAEVLTEGGRLEEAAGELRRCTSSFEAMGMLWYVAAAKRLGAKLEAGEAR